MKVALVHDYLREYGGAERVVEDLHEIFPEASTYTAYYNPKGLGIHTERIKKWDIKTSWMQKIPFANRLISPFRIFAPFMFESFNLKDFDVVISSSAIYFSQAVKVKPEALHICYIHTPPRYLYGYTTSYNYKKHLLTRIGGELMNHFLRIWDFQLMQKPDILVANSENVRQRIKKFYRRDSVVIYPGTEVEKIKNESSNLKTAVRSYYFCLGRLVRSKGIEIAIESCNKLKLPLKVAGRGPLLEEFKKMAGPTVSVLGGVTDAERVELLSNAKALLLLEEQPDFGITPVEAASCGTPVIAVRAGGYLETVVEGKTGQFIEEATVQKLSEALQNFDESKFKVEDCQKQAEKFSKEKFKEKMLELIDKNLKFIVMPELPEVETIRKGLEKKIVGLTVKSVEVLTPKYIHIDPKQLEGKKVVKIWRRAKILGVDLSGDLTLLFHLKMTGQLIFIGKKGEKVMGGHPTEDMKGQMPNSATRAIFHFVNGSNLYFNDLIKYGWIKVVNSSELIVHGEEILGKLGPEPLDKSFTWDLLKENLLKRKKTPVKITLMDQSVVAGIGNIYASESLFLARIDPRRLVVTLSDEEFKKLHKGIIESLEESIKHGGTTIKDYVNSEGKKGEFLQFANVYGKEGQKCSGCHGRVIKITQSGRGTYFCPSCQK